MAIGSRSQSARTYLERNLEAFKEASLEELLKHGMRALRDTLPNDVNLTSKVNKKPLLFIKIQYFKIYAPISLKISIASHDIRISSHFNI